MKPPGVRKDKEFDFFVPSKQRERERVRNKIEEQLDALEWEAADDYYLYDWNYEMANSEAFLAGLEKSGKEILHIRHLRDIPRDGTPVIVITEVADVLKVVPHKEPFPRSADPAWVETASFGKIIAERAIVGWFPVPSVVKRCQACDGRGCEDGDYRNGDCPKCLGEGYVPINQQEEDSEQ
jgi:hypothetical protein